MQIFARINNTGEEMPFEVEKSDKIIDIKRIILGETNLIATEQTLVNWDRILDDNKTIGEYHIFEGDVIDVFTGLGPGGVIIFVRHIDGMLFPLAVKKSDKIIDIKNRIQEKTGLPINKIDLVYSNVDGGTLQDDETIGESDKYFIHVYDYDWKPGGRQIHIRKNEKYQFSIEVLGSYIIRNIKYDIQQQIGLPRNEQILKYKGGTLDDDKTIGDYEIEDKHKPEDEYEYVDIFVRQI